MESQQDQLQLAIQKFEELTTDDHPVDANVITTSKVPPPPLNLQPTSKLDDENMNSFMGLSGISVLIEVVDVPMDTVGLIIGKNGSNIKIIQGQTGCQVQMAAPSLTRPGYRQVTLQGAKHQIEHAKVLINNIVMSRYSNAVEKNNNGLDTTASEVVTIEVLIPKENIGWLVGKGGENIRQLQEQLGVKMGLLQQNKEPTEPKPLQIMGYNDKVANAQRYIIENYVKTMVQRDKRNNSITVQITVPRDSVGRIIGKNGHAIKKICHASGANVQFKLDEDQHALERTVIINGNATQVNMAARLVREWCNEPQTVCMHVPADKAGLVIGKTGQTIRQIISESGARVQISADEHRNPFERVFEITGDPIQIQSAVQLIKARIGEVPPGLPHSTLPLMDVMSTPQARPYQNGNLSAGSYPFATCDTLENLNSNSIFGHGELGHLFPKPSYAQQPSYSSIVQSKPLPSIPDYAPQFHQYLPQTSTIQAPSQSSVQPPSLTVGRQPATQDYSAQWIQFYREIGMNEQANLLEQKVMKQQLKELDDVYHQVSRNPSSYAAIHPPVQMNASYSPMQQPK